MTIRPDIPRIVSARFDLDDAHTLDGYLRTGGYEALRKALGMQPSEVVDVVTGATLQGRGGGGFPAGNKWHFLDTAAFPRWIVCNGDESEPGTQKDRTLMERDPHSVIEGALIAAHACKASQVFLYVRGEMALAQERIAQALNEAYAGGYVGKNVMDTGWSMDVTLHWGAGAYIVGDETALIESLEGNRGMPRPKPPYFPAVKGLYMDPTIVNNVETLATIPWIVANGAEAFAALGMEKSQGTKLIAVSGHVKRPGTYEIECGVVTFREALYDPALGGGIRDDNELKAFIPGGGSAPWFYAQHLDLPMDPTLVGPAGSMLGSGAIVAMDETTDMVKACWRLVRFFARESCGKCTPCREGTSWMETILARILAGHGRPDDLDLLVDIARKIRYAPLPGPGVTESDPSYAPFPCPEKTTICDLGPSVVSPLASALRFFRPEFDAYIAKNTRKLIEVSS